MKDLPKSIETAVRSRLRQAKHVYLISFTSVDMRTDWNVTIHPTQFAASGFVNKYKVRAPPLAHSVLKGKCPQQSLHSTADHFMDHIPSDQYLEFEQEFREASGHTIRIGTACSGSDIFVTALAKMIQAMNDRLNILAA